MELDKQPKQVVRFYIGSVRDILASKQHKRDVYKDAIMINVINSKNDIVDRLAEDEHKRKFPRHWEKFIETTEYKRFIGGSEEEHAFTPVSEVSGVGPAVLKSLEAIGIDSAEALVNAEESDIDHIRGFKKIQDAALELIGDD
jgi:predicted RecB family nuclease